MNVDCCCLDASAFSLGFAASHSGTLILGKSENVLSDYVDPITPGYVSVPQTEEGRAFAEHLRKAGCVSDEGILDTPSLAPAAAEYALNGNFNVLIGVKIIQFEKDRVRIYTNSGLQDIVCGRIIRRPEVKTDGKRLHCIVSETDRDTLTELEKYGGNIYRSFEKDEFIVSLPFQSDCQLNEARIAFVNLFRACFGEAVLIDAFAADFAYDSPFGGIIEEFEAGVRL